MVAVLCVYGSIESSKTSCVFSASATRYRGNAGNVGNAGVMLVLLVKLVMLVLLVK